MKNKKETNPFESVEFSGIDQLKQAPVEAKQKFRNATINFYSEDLEFFKDWVFWMKTHTGDPSFTHKDAMKLLMKNVRETYKEVKERPDHEKEREKGRGRPVNKN